MQNLRGIRQELFEEIETVIKSFYPDLAFSELPSFQKLISCSTSSVKKLLCQMMKERTILIESCVDDQKLNSLNIVFLLFYMSFLYFTYN